MRDSMLVLDSHAHIGPSSISGIDVNENEMLEKMHEYQVDISFVLPHAFQDTGAKAIHDRIYALTQKAPGKIYGIASYNPRLDEEAYCVEIKRCIESMGFIGIKFEPVVHALPINHQTTKKVYEMAAKYKVPVLIHTGGSSFANPLKTISVAQEFPQLPIILAHSGFLTYFDEAMLAAKLCPNIYLECSWGTHQQLRAMVAAIGSERVMFGSDHLSNIPIEYSKIDMMLKDPKDRRNVMGETAKRLFKI